MEENITQAIAESFQNSTVIVIAHKIKTVINSDKIIVMEQG
jgi:ABC-type multidrug transport system fused ATPase/permease subunit